MLEDTSDFNVPYAPECNIVVFRHCPVGNTLNDLELDAFQLQLRRRIIESGDSYLVANCLDGKNVLRTTIINPLTKQEDLAQLIDHIRYHGKKLLQGQFP